MNVIQTWVTLLGLARRRFRSAEDYQRFQQFQAANIVRQLGEVGVDLKDRVVLDLGCGRGGYSMQFNALGAHVVALDRLPPPPGASMELRWAVADARQVPLANCSVDVVFCASLIEHVAQPDVMLSEIRRVLKPHGVCYLSFPPFYSLNGGHQFKPWHLLGEKMAVRLRGGPEIAYARPGDTYGLYPLTIRAVRGKIARAGFGLHSFRTRFFPVNLGLIPVAGEFLCWHAEFLLTRV